MRREEEPLPLAPSCWLKVSWHFRWSEEQAGVTCYRQKACSKNCSPVGFVLRAQPLSLVVWGVGADPVGAGAPATPRADSSRRRHGASGGAGGGLGGRAAGSREGFQ